jgi:hypothetical protein
VRFTHPTGLEDHHEEEAELFFENLSDRVIQDDVGHGEFWLP